MYIQPLKKFHPPFRRSRPICQKSPQLSFIRYCISNSSFTILGLYIYNLFSFICSPEKGCLPEMISVVLVAYRPAFAAEYLLTSVWHRLHKLLDMVRRDIAIPCCDQGLNELSFGSWSCLLNSSS
jgi:hypothetical protein